VFAPLHHETLQSVRQFNFKATIGSSLSLRSIPPARERKRNRERERERTIVGFWLKNPLEDPNLNGSVVAHSYPCGNSLGGLARTL
jgi:hypothetical protein